MAEAKAKKEAEIAEAKRAREEAEGERKRKREEEETERKRKRRCRGVCRFLPRYPALFRALMQNDIGRSPRP